jgi:hypothetical protein
MTKYWPTDWNTALQQAFRGSQSEYLVKIVFIGPDGQPDGEPLEIGAGLSTNEPARQK